jgi:Flp pilus assembly protein TadD
MSFGRTLPAIGLAGLLGGCAAHHPTTASAPRIATPFERQVRNAVEVGATDVDVRLLRAKIDANPADLESRIELARRYQKLGFPEIAIEHGRLAIERAPESEEAHTALASFLRSAGRDAEAAALLDNFLKNHEAPGANVWAWLGLIRDDAGDWKGGEAAYRRAIALAPQRDDLHNNLGYNLMRQGRTEEASTELRAALSINSHSEFARNNLGSALAEKPAEAITHLQSLADPATAHSNLAAALIEAGKYDEARKEIEIALSYNRTHSAALRNLALLSELDGRPAIIPGPAHVEGRWARIVARWRRLRDHRTPADRIRNDAGEHVASR